MTLKRGGNEAFPARASRASAQLVYALDHCVPFFLGVEDSIFKGALGMATFNVYASSSSGSTSQWQLRDPPKDGVTSVRFSKERGSDSLLVSSWDGTLTLYDTKLDSVSWKQTLTDEVPILDCVFVGREEKLALTGALDGKVRVHHLDASASNAASVQVMKEEHKDGVGCVGWCEDVNVGASGGWDKQFCTWDPRSKCSRVAQAVLPGKAFSLDISACRAVIACAERKILIYDLRNLSKPEQVRQSSLQHQIRIVSCSPAELDAYAIGTVDGRVAIEYFDPKIHSKKKFAFKCHRVKSEPKTDAGADAPTTIAYPVNAISFHPKLGTFATGGGDGNVVTWDAINRRRITTYSQYSTSISSLSFNCDGSRLAVANSYTFEQGEIENKPKDSIFIRVVQSEEVQPKEKSKKRSRD